MDCSEVYRGIMLTQRRNRLTACLAAKASVDFDLK